LSARIYKKAKPISQGVVIKKNKTMETADNRNQTSDRSIENRNPEIDIVKGASNTSSIPNEKKSQKPDSAGTTVGEILDVVKDDKSTDKDAATNKELDDPSNSLI
jgi:hypothetical protein